ncbi:MAG: flagellar motor protein MotB [Deltaproteobacteria bacterium]|nr:flagellar motor protein MotB [Deltaproteobacteria bacterium]
MKRIQGRRLPFIFLFMIFWVSIQGLPASAAVTPTMIIEEAKFAIEQARKAGAEMKAFEDLASAKSWLIRAEKEYALGKTLISKARKMVMEDRVREEEIIYLGTMAKLKAMTAEARARKQDIAEKANAASRDLADYQSAVSLLKKKGAESEKAREVQAQAEKERKELEEAKRKAAEMEAVREKELQEARIQEAKRAAERERELAEAKLKAEQLTAARAKEERETKAQEEKLRDLKKKAEILERKQNMLADASRIPQATTRATEKEVIITILAINLFTPANEVKPAGKSVLDDVGRFLQKYPQNAVMVRGHTDSQGSSAVNEAVSEKRGQKVREYLVANQNIDPNRITAQGLGPTQPVAANTTEAGRTLNRRVEIAIQTGE